jgi:hypothetical protein
MTPGVRRSFTGCADALVVTTPGVAAGEVLGPSVVVDAPASVRAVASFVLVMLCGGALLYQYEGFVDRSVDSSKDHLLRSVVYGVVAYGLVGFAFAYLSIQLFRLGSGGLLSTVVVAVVATAVSTLTSLGFVVVGTLLTELQGRRQPWTGLVVGAAVSAFTWFVLPPLAGLVAWFAVAAVGIGGPTRAWVHASRDVRAEREG